MISILEFNTTLNVKFWKMHAAQTSMLFLCALQYNAVNAVSELFHGYDAEIHTFRLTKEHIQALLEINLGTTASSSTVYSTHRITVLLWD